LSCVAFSIKKKTESLKTEEKQCILCLDQMSIRPSLRYLTKSDKIIGFEDMSVKSCGKEPATTALYFMIRGLNENWKQIIGYFFTCRGMPGEAQKIHLCQCIKLVEEIGLKVVGIVCDQGANNIKMANALGITVEQPYFEFNNENKYFFMTHHTSLNPLETIF